jgi:dihydroorotate dehydrogenase electron transfer subunit
MTHTAIRSRRAGEGPLQAACEVVAAGDIGGYRALTLATPEMAARAEPGQFVSLGVDAPGAVLRRPFSIAAVDADAGTLQVVFDVVGRGTAWLATRAEGNHIDVVGPLGRPFALPPQPTRCLLVGGGYGAAPLLYLSDALRSAGHEVETVFGAATEARVFNAEEAVRRSASTRFTTEDGTLGSQGLVTDVLPAIFAEAEVGLVYACGPMAMLRAVAEVAAAHDLPCQVAVEEQMACSTGVCYTCVIPLRRSDGITNVRACTEGPVLDGAAIAWDAIGTPAMGNALPDRHRPAPGQARA